MTGHTYHRALPYHDKRQIWHDGCDECETRGKDPVGNLGHLDAHRFNRAWKRAALSQGGERWTDETGICSQAEIPLLRMLWAIQVAFEVHRGIPLGRLPHGD